MWWRLFSLLEKLVEIGRRVGGQQCIHRVFGHGRVHDSFGALWATRWLCVWVGERGRRGMVCVGRGFFGRGCGGGGWKYCGAASSGGIFSVGILALRLYGPIRLHAVAIMLWLFFVQLMYAGD